MASSRLPSPLPYDKNLPALKSRLEEIVARLAETYPDAECALHHRSPWELVVATILSAQCTDERVNKVTPELFARFPTPAAFAAVEREAIEPLVQSTGFFRNKAKSIHGAATRLVETFNSRVPETMDELLTLPGVARKTANVVLGTSFGKAFGVVVDTHVFRLSHRLGLAQAKSPTQVEQQLMELLPTAQWISWSHRLIHHGRQVCRARKPECERCVLEPLCPQLGVDPPKSEPPIKRTGPSLAEKIRSAKTRKTKKKLRK